MSESEHRLSGPILVTGGAGFIGSHLIDGLSHRTDATIVSVDNYSTGTPANHIKSPKVRYLEGHTQNIEELWRSANLPEPTAIFHLGEYSRIYQSFGDIQELWRSNMTGTFQVVDWAARNGSFLLYAGSSSKFGNDGKDENLAPYNWTKAKACEFINNMGGWYPHALGENRTGLESAITYFYNVYGPRHIRDGKGATVIGIWERQYLNGEPLGVVSPGTQTRDFTHVEDIVDGIITVAEKGSGDGYHLGYGQERSLLETAGMFDAPIRMLEARQGERESGQAPQSRAQELGWRAKIDIIDYIDQFKRDHPRIPTNGRVHASLVRA